ncbi:hypothetical protein TWF730_002262 [Orbilia blumenaviensis]|uniref:F-box domain-containing protein n=1 Tax=Orbilia blumenaviensis TaxID=1796055 RepID=A0AAV9U9C2_9PEZI
MSLSLLSLPRELVDEILSYVSKRDFKRFSRCSRVCRGFIIPLVFSRIDWRTPYRAEAFRDGGTVGHLRPVVYHISMYMPGRPNELLRNIAAFEIYMDVLTLFPNVKSLWINLTTISDLETNLIHAIFNKLSAAPAFHTLKSLNLTCKRYPQLSLHDLSGARKQDFYAALPEKYQEYLGPKIGMDDDVDPPPGPPGLRELVVVTNQFSLTPSRRAEPNVSFLHSSCMKTLTKLRIRSDILGAPMAHKDWEQKHWFSWDGLKQVHLELNQADFSVLSEISGKFPDVEDLVITKNGAWFGLGGASGSNENILYNALQGMKKLKRVRVPQPNDLFPNQIGENHGFGYTEYLKDVVNQWIQRGADMLEKVIFAKDGRSTVMQGKSWDKMVQFDILRDKRALQGEPKWKLNVQTWDMIGFYVQGVGQRSIDELFGMSPQKAPVDSYGKTTWFS